MRLSYAIPFILLLAPGLFTYRAENFRSVAPLVGYWQLILLGISVLILPPLFKGATKHFYTLVTTQTEGIKVFKEPQWGKYNPWLYLQRQTASLGLIPLSIFIVLMLTNLVYFEGINQSVFAITLCVFVTIPISIVMQEEKTVPYRWRLAPFSSNLKKAIWIKMCLPLFALALSAVVIMGYSHQLWIIVILLNLLSVVIISSSQIIIEKPALQQLLYFLAIVVCLLAQLAW
jgi:hypothetical protein